VHFGGDAPPEMQPSETSWSQLNTRSANPVSWYVKEDVFTEPKEECFFIRTQVPGFTQWYPVSADSLEPTAWQNGKERSSAVRSGKVSMSEAGMLPLYSNVVEETSTYCFASDPVDCILGSSSCPYDLCWVLLGGDKVCTTKWKPCYVSVPVEYKWSRGVAKDEEDVICGTDKIEIDYANPEYDNLTVPTNQQKIFFTYLYSIMGHLKKGKFPDSLLPGNGSEFELSHDCHHAVIEVRYEVALVGSPAPKMPPSLSGGNGKLPINCINTNICSIHWCDSDEITIFAGDTTPFYFYIYDWGMEKQTVHPVASDPPHLAYNGYGEPTRIFCLKNEGDVDCPTSITFTAYQHTPLTSSLKTRSMLTISNSKQSIQCFNFPYEYSWVGYRSSLSGNSAISSYFTDTWLPPATLIERSQLLNVALSLEGTAVATYQIILGDNQKKIFAQVCNSDEASVPLRLEQGMGLGYLHTSIINANSLKEVTAISDDGSTIAIGLERQHVKIWFKDLINDQWDQESSLGVVTSINAVIDHIYLSTSGYFLSIIQGTELLLYQKSLYLVGYDKVSETTSSATIKKASIEAMESGNVSIQYKTNTAAETTFEVIPYLNFITFVLIHT